MGVVVSRWYDNNFEWSCARCHPVHGTRCRTQCAWNTGAAESVPRCDERGGWRDDLPRYFVGVAQLERIALFATDATVVAVGFSFEPGGGGVGKWLFLFRARQHRLLLRSARTVAKRRPCW
jgi:hypothetical protein